MTENSSAHQPTRFFVQVNRIWNETARIKGFELVSTDGRPLPSYTPGSHITVHLPSGLTRQYSMSGDPIERNRYEIGVLNAPDGGGGSAEMHERIRVGDALLVDGPRNDFPLVEDTAPVLLVAGGIGITPLLSMARCMNRQSRPYKLYYCTRSATDTAYLGVFSHHQFNATARLIHDNGDPARGLDLARLIADMPAGMHVYYCGPKGFMDAMRRATSGLDPKLVHFESFLVADTHPETATGGKGFEVELARSGRTFLVAPGETILEALRRNGVMAESMCEQGYCGTCVVKLLAGAADHHDTVLTDEEKDSNSSIALCCSRAATRSIRIDL